MRQSPPGASTSAKAGGTLLLSILAVLGLLAALDLGNPTPGSAGTPSGSRPQSYRWWGHDFVFILMTDDSNGCNSGWVEKGLEMDFRFTMAVNGAKLGTGLKLTTQQLSQYDALGFEVANHSWSHCNYGMKRCLDIYEPPDCDPLFGDVRGYFTTEGSFATLAEAWPYFNDEVDPCLLASIIPEVSCADIRTYAYSRTGHTKAVIDSLILRGYIGARDGYGPAYTTAGDFDAPPRNTWDGGISLYRVPTIGTCVPYFGDHSADPPVHFTYEEFLAATTPLVESFVATGGMMVLAPHHYGDDDTCHSLDWGYGVGGLTPTDLEWLVDLVRSHNGAVATFEEAVSYYRSVSEMVDIDGDFVWEPTLTDAPAVRDLDLAAAFPNPFNPQTTLSFHLPSTGPVRLAIYDLKGRRVRELLNGMHAAGEFRIAWDGRDAQGQRLPSGVYVARLDGSGSQVTRKLVLAK